MDRQELFDHKNGSNGKSFCIVVDDPIHGILSRPEIREKLKELEDLIGAARMTAIRDSHPIIIESRISRHDAQRIVHHGRTVDHIDFTERLFSMQDWSKVVMMADIPEPVHRLSYDVGRTHPVSDQHRTKPSPGKSLGKKKWWEHR